MQPEFKVANTSPRTWLDFYSILDTAPQADTDTLRKTINKMYVQAHKELDHRELSRRFYCQVLSQKVLPQCRRILLDQEMRRAYDEQWQLHHDGSETAISYSEFFAALAKNSHADATTMLTESELAILPSFQPKPKASTSVDSAPATAPEPQSAPASESAPEPESEPASESQPEPAQSTSTKAASAPVVVPANPVVVSAEEAIPGKSSEIKAPVAAAKKSNLGLIGGVAVVGLALLSGALLLSSRQKVETPSVPASVPASDAPQTREGTSALALQKPLLLNFNSMPGIFNGDAKLSPGFDGDALVLNGTGSVELPQTLDTSQSYTVMTWARIDKDLRPPGGLSPFETFISADGPTNSAFFLQVRGDTKRFAFTLLPPTGDVPIYAGAQSDYKMHTWYHLAGVYDAPTHVISLYINGRMESSVSCDLAYKSLGTLRLGNAKFGSKAVDFTTGALDNAQIFQKVLSGADIAAIVKPLKAKAGIK